MPPHVLRTYLSAPQDEASIGAEDKPAGVGGRKKVPFLGLGYSPTTVAADLAVRVV